MLNDSNDIPIGIEKYNGKILLLDSSKIVSNKGEITIIGDQPLSRTTVFQVGQANNPTTLETEFDNVLIRQQQLQEQLDRSIQLKPTTGRTVTGSEFSTTGPLYFPEPTANKVLSFNSAGTGLEATNTLTDITALAGIASDISTVSGIAANVTTVAGDETDIGVVAGSISSVNTLAGISGLSTLASNSANVTIAATNISSINTAAADITNINNAPTHATNAAASATAAAASASSAAASAGGGTVKVTSADTSPNDLNTKLLVQGITKTVGNAGGNETLTLKGGADIYAFKKTVTSQTYNRAVTVVSSKFVIDGISQDTLTLYEGNTYIFDVSDASNNTHVFRFATAADAAGSTEYTTGVTNSGTAGTGGATVTIAVPVDAPALYYYCTAHASMGGSIITTLNPQDLILHYTNQADNIDVANADSTATDIFDESFIAPAGVTIAINASGYLTMTV